MRDYEFGDEKASQMNVKETAFYNPMGKGDASVPKQPINLTPIGSYFPAA